MGRGELAGKNQFIDYLDEETPLSVSYLAFSTTKGATGLWQFYNITGTIRAMVETLYTKSISFPKQFPEI